MRVAVLCLSCFLLLWPCPAQTPPEKPLPGPDSLLPDTPGNYLAPLQALRAAQSRYEHSPQWRSLFFQELGQQEAFVGNDVAAIADDDRASDPASPGKAASLHGYHPQDARQAVLRLAETHRVLFINEAHNVPMGRAFILSLLKGLYRRGFRYYAAETFREQDTGLQTRGYPVQKTGYYTSEPVFGDTVRTALKLGFTLVPYEYTGPMRSVAEAANPLADENRRERGEAQNLYNRTLKHDPKAKVLVQAGYAHISRQVMEADWPAGALGTTKATSGTLIPMAVYFQRMGGVAPFSIDQTSLYAHSAPVYENALYRYMTGHGLVKDRPVLFQNAQGQCFVPPAARGVYNAAVCHPRPRYASGRPAWLSMNGLRRAVALPPALSVPQAEDVLVQAFYAGEDAAQAVPVDQIEYVPGLHPLPTLMLPPGRFLVRVVNTLGNTVQHQLLTVKE